MADLTSSAEEIAAVRAAVRPHLRESVNWHRSDVFADFVVRSLRSVDEEGHILHPATMHGWGTYAQMAICGWIKWTCKSTEPIQDITLTDSGLALLRALADRKAKP